MNMPNWLSVIIKKNEYEILVKPEELAILANRLVEDVFRIKSDFPDTRFGKRKGIYKSDYQGILQFGLNVYNCTDTVEGQCIDAPCTNYGGHGNSCEDKAGAKCLDSLCSNKDQATCTDGYDCHDNPCSNYQCSDNGTNSSYRCTDDTCLNTGSGDWICVDGNCIDQNCLNHGNECKDTNCEDKVCANWKTGTTCSDPTDGRCTNQPYCGDVYSCDVSSNCTDTNCEDNGGATCTNGDGTHSSNVCLDSNNCKDISCINITNCVDYRPSGGTACKDDNCSNTVSGEFKSNCLDVTNCYDTKCKNNSFCFDNDNCLDEDCENTSVCMNVGTFCVDVRCSNTGKCEIVDPLEPIEEPS